MSFDKCIQLCNYRYNQDTEYFQNLKTSPYALNSVTGLSPSEISSR